MSKPEPVHGTGCQQFSFVREQNMVVPGALEYFPFGFVLISKRSEGSQSQLKSGRGRKGCPFPEGIAEVAA